MKALGCLGLLVVLSWLCLEAWAYIATAHWLNATFADSIGSGGWWLPALWIVVMGFVGARIIKYHIAKVVPALLMGNAGRHVVGALGGLFLAIPGLLSDVLGVLLLLPPVQILLGKFGNALVAVIVKRTMGSMFGGGAAKGGGFPGFGGPFPGMMPKADDHIGFRKPPGKTYDTVAERE